MLLNDNDLKFKNKIKGKRKRKEIFMWAIIASWGSLECTKRNTCIQKAHRKEEKHVGD